VEPRAMGRWTPAFVAAAVLVVVVAASAFAGKDEGETSASTPDTAAVLDASSSAVPATSSTIPASTQPKSTLDRRLAKGSSGPEVQRLQERLIELKFDPNGADGQFGTGTQQAVWAFQKLVMGIPREDADGVVSPDMWDLMQGPVTIAPRRSQTTPTHVEVYLPEQVMVVFKNNAPVLVTHVSSGTGETWCEVVTIDPGEQGNEHGEEPIEKGICGVSKTTGGVFYFYRRYVKGDGWREGSLGRMYKPVYWNVGLAVHGSGNVPNKPASHGCVRTPMHIAEYFPDLVEYGDQIFVWDGVKDPEDYGRQPPVYDYPDPSYTTTSTTTTTTTIAATTTAAKATTTTAARTTTTLPPSTTVAPPQESSTTTAPPPSSSG
jgi:Putative peptidoglycan binding domain/L,D-transpeptidase catalytic domain